MLTKIGYIASQHSNQKMMTLVKQVEHIEIKSYIYKDLTDIPLLYERAVQETDAICFSGIISHYYRDEQQSHQKPVIVTPFHQYMIVTTILHAIINKKISIEQLSFDLPDALLLQQIENDLSYSFNLAYVYDYPWIYEKQMYRTFPFHELVDFHEKLFRLNKTKLAITSVHAVYDELLKRQVPVMFMVDFEENMKQVLVQARELIMKTRLRDGMIATLKFTFNQMETTEQTLRILYDNLRKLNPSLAPSIQDEHKGNVTFFTTRGVIESSLLPKEQLHWIMQLERQLTHPFSFGIGYGRTLLEAEDNAMRALRLAIELEDSNGYILTEELKMIGPLLGKTIADETRIADEWLTSITDETNTSFQTMLRFVRFMKQHDFQPFTAKDLTLFSNVSDRTTERFLKRLLEAEMIYIFAHEQTINTGRPRTVYRLSEEIEQNFRLYKKY